MCAGSGFVGMSGMLVLKKLGRAKLDEITRFLWTLLILLLPVVGSVAYFIVNPGGGE